jgi:DNA-binding MarR family transcriptional regulator
MSSLCDEPLIDRFFSVIGRLGIFSLILDPANELTMNQLSVLFHLYYHGGRAMGQIAARLQTSDPTTTGIIDRLVERELVERTADPQDRRRVLVRLTESGREHVYHLRCAGAEAASAAFSQLTGEQREALMNALAPVSQLLSRDVENDPG